MTETEMAEIDAHPSAEAALDAAQAELKRQNEVEKRTGDWDPGKYKPQTLAQLLVHYAHKKPRAFAQYDGFSGMTGDDFMQADENGHAVFGWRRSELMGSPFDVRVLVDPEAKREDVLALLEKITDFIRRGGVQFDDRKFEGRVDILTRPRSETRTTVSEKVAHAKREALEAAIIKKPAT